VNFSALTYDDTQKTKPADWLAEHGWGGRSGPHQSPKLQASLWPGPPSEVDLQVDQIMHSEIHNGDPLSPGRPGAEDGRWQN